MDLHNILSQITFINLIFLILSISYALFSDQMRVEKTDINTQIGLLYNCSKISSDLPASNHETHAHNSNEAGCKIIEFSKDGYYRGNLKNFLNLKKLFDVFQIYFSNGLRRGCYYTSFSRIHFAYYFVYYENFGQWNKFNYERMHLCFKW